MKNLNSYSALTQNTHKTYKIDQTQITVHNANIFKTVSTMFFENCKHNHTQT